MLSLESSRSYEGVLQRHARQLRWCSSWECLQLLGVLAPRSRRDRVVTMTAVLRCTHMPLWSVKGREC